LIIAACQPLPHPFQPADKDANALLWPGARTGIVVKEIAGAPAPRALAGEMARALREAEIVASATAGNRQSFLLFASATAAPLDAMRDEIQISWRLEDSRGRPVGEFHQTAQALKPAWKMAAAPLLRVLAKTAAPEIARLLAGTDASPIPAGNAPRVVILPVDNAPGDGRDSLARAMAFHLRKAGVRLSEEITDDSLVLLGSVRLAAAPSGTQRVAITWTAISSEGAEVGTVTQNARVPAGALDGPWGALAHAAAKAAASGVAELIERQAARRPDASEMTRKRAAASTLQGR
jgi:hypothetical protein